MGTPLDVRPDVRGDVRRGQHRRACLALAWALLVLPSAFANEPLDEDFLLFLSDWTDDSGEFTPPSDVEETWPDDLAQQEPARKQPAVEREDQVEQGEPDE